MLQLKSHVFCGRGGGGRGGGGGGRGGRSGGSGGVEESEGSSSGDANGGGGGTISSRAGALGVHIVDIKRSAALPTRRTSSRGVRAVRGGAIPKKSARRRRPS
ncbi:unnamed protein product [Ectocarpus sp. CCAP 1310/34]|nr:unnamed protein product [Ectocarpus sp. CCAP 1310/34]